MPDSSFSSGRILVDLLTSFICTLAFAIPSIIYVSISHSSFLLQFVDYRYSCVVEAAFILPLKSEIASILYLKAPAINIGRLKDVAFFKPFIN